MAKPLTKKKRATPQISDKQKAINDLWRRFNSAMEDLEEFIGEAEGLADEFDFDASKAINAAGDAHMAMDEAYSNGARILPPHSLDGGKA